MAWRNQALAHIVAMNAGVHDRLGISYGLRIRISNSGVQVGFRLLVALHVLRVHARGRTASQNSPWHEELPHPIHAGGDVEKAPAPSTTLHVSVLTRGPVPDCLIHGWVLPVAADESG